LALRGPARALSLRARGSARALLAGSHRSAHHGRGLEFEEVRPYVAGDDPRSIDWRVTARRGRVHTKLFREERERPVWLLVDLNPSLFFGSRLQLKSAVAVRAAALLAWSVSLGGDRVGAVIANGSATQLLPPRAREAGVLPLLRALVELQPRAPAEPTPQCVSQALQMLAPLVRPGSLVLAVSDFAATEATDQARWAVLAARSECRWFWVTDALERDGLPNGRFRAGQPQRVLALDGSAIRTSWQRAWEQRAKRIAASARALQIGVMQLDSGTDWQHTLQLALRPAKSVV
jgi:uncharacterized protein (DUF58 family)